MSFQIFIMMNVFVAVARSSPIPNEYPQQRSYPWRDNSLDDGKLTTGRIRSIIQKFENYLFPRLDENRAEKNNVRQTYRCDFPNSISNDVESMAWYSPTGSNPCAPMKRHSRPTFISKLMAKTEEEQNASSNHFPFGK